MFTEQSARSIYAPDITSTFENHYGVRHYPRLRDGDDFTGRIRRVARRLGLDQDRRDKDLFDRHGGRASVRASLAARWRDPRIDLISLNAAETRLMLMICLDRAATAPMSILDIDPVVGHGVFADGVIRAGEVIGEYTGLLRKSGPDDFANHFLATTPPYGRFDGFIIDGQNQGNITRFINHSHRAPNVSNVHVFHAKRWHRVLRADRVISAGEQILWDYGEDYWREREAPADL